MLTWGETWYIFYTRIKKQNTMSDDKNIRGPQDRSRINIHEDYELQYWSEKFGVSTDELKKAVAAVGVSAKDVEAFLGKR